MKKLINDTLKGPNGKWSRKSIILFVSFTFVMMLGTYIVIANYLTIVPLSIYAIQVYESLLFLVATLTGITVWDKKTVTKKIEEDEE